MAKLGTFSYPDIRFGDAVEIAGRILAKFRGTVSVKGLAWELGMAEGSGTLFAKVAALRDFGLIEGRGELRISALAQRVLHPAGTMEGLRARAEAFQRVELLGLLYSRFDGEVPDDMSLLVGLEEITRASRGEIVRRASLLQKHLTDAIRVLGRPVHGDKTVEPDRIAQAVSSAAPLPHRDTSDSIPRSHPTSDPGLRLTAGGRSLEVPLTVEYIDLAVGLLATLRAEIESHSLGASAADLSGSIDLPDGFPGIDSDPKLPDETDSFPYDREIED